MTGKPVGPPLPAWVAVFWTISGFLELATCLYEWSAGSTGEAIFYAVVALAWFGGGIAWHRQRRRAGGG